jgi:hypothetical protein
MPTRQRWHSREGAFSVSWEKARWVEDGSGLTQADFLRWLYVPLPDGRKKTLDRFVACEYCRHIRFQRIIYFDRANAWFWIKFRWQILEARVWTRFARSCPQCEFNRKVGRST